MQLFFSRRIGIAQGGTQVPIQGGARLSGRAGDFNVGLLHIRTDGLDGVQPGSAYSVARVARELPSRSRIGALVASRDAYELTGDYSRTYAVDGQMGLGDAFTLTGVVERTDTPDRDGRDVGSIWAALPGA